MRIVTACDPDGMPARRDPRGQSPRTFDRDTRRHGMSTSRAVVLARGLGSRMRKPDPLAALTLDQAQAADAGVKAMMPVNGRPFLDFVLSSLADAGISDVALIVAPDHDAVRAHYVVEARPARVAVAFLVQDEALGTANALLTAEAWSSGRPFLTVNADNLYPPPALHGLAQLDRPGLAAFTRGDLVRHGNIPPDRIKSFALVDVDDRGCLTRIVEKPVVEATGPSSENDLVSMNCWCFDSRIFPACRDVPRSARGEFELPEAVALALTRGVEFAVLRASGGVLDLSTRADAPDVTRRLSGIEPRP